MFVSGSNPQVTRDSINQKRPDRRSWPSSFNRQIMLPCLDNEGTSCSLIPLRPVAKKNLQNVLPQEQQHQRRPQRGCRYTYFVCRTDDKSLQPERIARRAHLLSRLSFRHGLSGNVSRENTPENRILHAERLCLSTRKDLRRRLSSFLRENCQLSQNPFGRNLGDSSFVKKKKCI